MKAVCWNGKQDVRVEDVPEPRIVNPHDAIVRVSLTAICGSDLHLYNGSVPTMKPGDVLGHEFMGEVVEVGRKVEKLKPGNRVVVPFAIACGQCWFCRHELWSCCDNSTPTRTCWRRWPASRRRVCSAIRTLRRISRRTGRVRPRALRRHRRAAGPPELPDERVLFLSDIFPTGYQAAEQ